MNYFYNYRANENNVKPYMGKQATPTTMPATMPATMPMTTYPSGAGCGGMCGGMGMGQMPAVIPSTTGTLGATFGQALPAEAGIDTAPMTVGNVEYTQGYLATQIGKRVKVEFLIGTNMLVDREGTLVDVGISYIVIREVDTDDLLLCDMYSIKFVRFYF